MIARAPGKVVISGAYAVLDGAPGLVTAVDRYVTADAARAPDFVTEELRAALGGVAPPWFDASELRRNGKKLGLGSSAAILVASLAALELRKSGPLADAALARAVFEPSRRAHQQAQRGGSGIDVAAAAYGGTLLARRIETQLALEPSALPAELCFEIFVCGEPASTADLVARVRALRGSAPELYERRIGAQREAAELAAVALRDGHGADFVASLRAQRRALSELGDASGVPIVTREVRELAALAESGGSAFLPAGAGGGDIAVYAGFEPPGAAFRGRAAELGSSPLAVRLGARGVHAFGSTPSSE